MLTKIFPHLEHIWAIRKRKIEKITLAHAAIVGTLAVSTNRSVSIKFTEKDKEYR